MSMGIIAWIVLGLIAGVIAKSLLGGRAASEIFQVQAAGGFFDLSTWIIAIIGSVVLLLIYQVITSSSYRPMITTTSRRRARRQPDHPYQGTPES